MTLHKRRMPTARCVREAVGAKKGGGREKVTEPAAERATGDVSESVAALLMAF